ALLDLSRLERGMLDIVLETVDLRDVVRQTLEPYRARITEAQLTLADELPAKHIRVQADARRIGQILDAMIENAIKFTPRGGQIRVALAARQGRIELVVTDTGPGVAAGVLAPPFTPSVQGKNARR